MKTKRIIYLLLITFSFSLYPIIQNSSYGYIEKVDLVQQKKKKKKKSFVNKVIKTKGYKTKKGKYVKPYLRSGYKKRK